eukprot:3415455-Prymnesium_polylepis.1
MSTAQPPNDEFTFKWDGGDPLPAVPKRGFVVFRTLTDVDRTDHPGGAGRGPPGQPATTYITFKDEGERAVGFGEILQEGSQFVLYAVEAGRDDPVLVFLQLKPAARRALYETEAFIDRGIRKQVELGSRVAFCSLTTAEAYLSEAASNVDSGTWRLSFVWNTGRCGSTLLHKAVLAKGAVSLSEPHWLDQLLKAAEWRAAEPALLQRVLRGCSLIDVLLSRRQRSPAGWTRATLFSFNPKMGGAAHLQEAAAL